MSASISTPCSSCVNRTVPLTALFPSGCTAATAAGPLGAPQRAPTQDGTGPNSIMANTRKQDSRFSSGPPYAALDGPLTG